MIVVKRKSTLLVLALAVSQLLVFASAFAQSAEQQGGAVRHDNEFTAKRNHFGLRVGLNSSSASIPSGYGDATAKSGFVISFIGQSRYSNNIYGCSELAYSAKGWKQDVRVYDPYYDIYSVVNMQWDLAYLDADYYVKFLIPTHSTVSPLIAVGLTTGYLISAKLKAAAGGNSASVDAMDAFKKFDIGFMLGVGAEMDIKSAKLAFDIRFNPGLVSVDNGGEDFKNKVMSFSATILF